MISYLHKKIVKLKEHKIKWLFEKCVFLSTYYTFKLAGNVFMNRSIYNATAYVFCVLLNLEVVKFFF